MPAPSRSTPIPFLDLSRAHASLAVELRAAFDRVLTSSGFILGEEVERFETEFATMCGVRHCVGVASGTAALTIMLRAAGIGSGDEVIVPAHTFVASALAIVHAGARPVCADVESATGLLDPAAVEAAISARTAAILPVHLYGQVCAMDELRVISQRHGVALFEDAAQAHGATYRDKRAGALSRAGAFSFYPSKNLGALGDGGAICTDDDELADRARQLRDLGRSTGGTHAVAGYNERLDGLQAAFVRVKMCHIDAWNEARRELAAHYRELLSGVVELLHERAESPCIYHLFPIRVDDRAGLADALAEFQIGTGVHYPLALPDQPALAELIGADAPVARDWAARELSLPMYPDLTMSEVDAIATATKTTGLVSNHD